MPTGPDPAPAPTRVAIPGISPELVQDLLDAAGPGWMVPDLGSRLAPFGSSGEAASGVSLLLALLGAFLALQRGIGRGLGHVPMSSVPAEQEHGVHA